MRAGSAWVQSWHTKCGRNTAQQKKWLGVGRRTRIEKSPKALLLARTHMLSGWAHSVWGVLSLIPHGPVALAPFLHPWSSWISYKCLLLVIRGYCEMGQHSSKFILLQPECMIPSHMTSIFLWEWIILKGSAVSYISDKDIKKIIFPPVLNLKYNELNKRKTCLWGS